ncbi:MAG TPA: response regulator, partial [Kofleriaceae bacterium]|nr:response regulator [Kofleriaceae bacterium]
MPRATLLVVDDEPNILSTVRRALELEGYTVLVAQSGRAALATVDDCGPGGVDLVLLDVVMPDMSGLEVLEVLRARHRDVVAVMMSGNATIETAVRATRL